MPEYRYTLCDVFTDQPLTGNGLAVFGDGAAVPDRWLQPLARELNLAETVFVYPPRAGGDARIRIFTPTAELPFAGHPVLGTAVVLAQERGLSAITLETGAGPVPVTLDRDGTRVTFGRMAQPLPAVEPLAAEAELLAALGVARPVLPIAVYVNGPRHVLVTLDSEAAVAALGPDPGALARVPGVQCVNCFAGAGTRWKTRMFAPAIGIAEDPATGSAAGPLAMHLARHGRIAFGEEIRITQGVEIGRPSVLFARAEGSAARVTRIEVGGAAVVVGRGEFSLPT